MNVLLTYPEFPETFWSYKHALKFIDKRAVMPPLGLMTIASMLPEEWNLRMVDMNVQRLKKRDLEWADYVFLSAMVAQRDSAVEVIERCKTAGVPVVAGGPLFIGEHEHFPDVAHFIINESELLMPEFVSDLVRGEAKHIYECPEHPNLSETPAPMWKLAKTRRYAQMCIQFSRGCPFACDFCNVTAMLGHVPRTKSAEQFIHELDCLYKSGWRGQVFIVDDNFIGNKRILKNEVLPALIEWRADKPEYSFSTEVSINLADDQELLDLMVAAGFTGVFIGIETPDEESLAECSKLQNKNRNMADSIRHLQRSGLDVQAGFIVGFDSDKPNIFDRQIKFIQETGIITAMVGTLQALNGTQLYERLRREGRLLEESSGNNTDASINFIPRMDPQILLEGYQRILENIYAPDAYYQRVRTFLNEYVPANVVKSRLTFPEIRAFFKSIVLLGIKERERVQYWKLFLWTLFNRPQLFPKAITYSIYGFHFRRVWEAYAQ